MSPPQFALLTLLFLLSTFGRAELLDDAACDRICARIFALEINDWPGVQWQTTKSKLSIVSENALNNLQSEQPAVKELIAILSAESQGNGAIENLETSKAAIQAWADKHQVGFKMAWPSDIRARGQKDISSGLRDWRTRIMDNSNGLIDFYLWNQLVAEGYFPISDPHDVLTHLPSMLLPGFSEALKSKARLAIRLYPHIEATISILSPEKRAAVERLNFLLQVEVRPRTWENLAFIAQDKGRPRLILHGNYAFRFTDAIANFTQPSFWGSLRTRRSKVKEMVDVLLPPLPKKSWNENMLFFGLAKRSEYLSEKKQAYQRLLDSQKALGWESKEAYERKRTKLTNICNELLERGPMLRKKSDRPDVQEFVDALAEKIQTDPELRASFNAKSRIDLQESAVGLYSDYLNWLGIP